MRPDGSVGILFAKYLKNNHPELLSRYKMYSHKFPSGMTVDARQYENEVLPTFIHFVDNIWMPERASDYFKKRDPLALEYIPKLIGKVSSTPKLSSHNKALKTGLKYNPKE